MPRASRPRRRTSPASARCSTRPPSDPDAVAPTGEVEQLTDRAEDALTAAMPDAWQKETDESDYDLIALTLDRMEAAAGAGEYRQAEQARLEAYAFFEFGPERRLKAFDPGLALDVEGLMWFGALDKPGLAKLIANHAARREIRETRLVLDRKLADSAATLGDSANKATVVTNSAIIVFREGLEAVLILAAITASFVGVRRRLRRPVLVGAALGLVASIVTWALAQTLLRLARAVRREARGGGRAGRDRRAADHHELVLPPRLLVGVDREVPPPAQAPRGPRRRALRLPLGPGRSAWPCSGSRASTARASRPSCSCSRWSCRPARRRCSRAPASASR